MRALKTTVGRFALLAAVAGLCPVHATATLGLDFQISLNELPGANDANLGSGGTNIAAIGGDNDGVLYLGGGTSWQGPFFRHSGIGLQPLIAKYTDFGSLVWARPINRTGSGQVLQVEAAPGGAGVYAAGLRALPDPTSQPGATLSNTAFVGLWDADGQAVWSVDVAASGDDPLFTDAVFDDVTVLPTGGVAATGRVGAQAVVHRYDSAGVGGEVWSLPDTVAQFSRTYAVEPFPDGDLLVVGDLVPAEEPDIARRRGFATRISPSGEERWSVTLPAAPDDSFGFPRSTSLLDGAVTSDGAAYVSGSGPAPGSDGSASVVRLIRNGVVQWTRTILDEGTTLYGVAGASDDFFVHGQQNFSGPATVTRYGPTGATLGQAVFDASQSGAAAPFDYASDVFVDDDGFAYAVGQAGGDWFVSVISGPLDGDFNRDGVVDAADYTVWRDFEFVSGPNVPGDANGDGQVDGADYDLWVGSFGQVRVSGSTALPEPGALSVAVLVGAGVCAARRNRQ